MISAQLLVHLPASRAATGMLEVFATKVVLHKAQ